MKITIEHDTPENEAEFSELIDAYKEAVLELSKQNPDDITLPEDIDTVDWEYKAFLHAYGLLAQEIRKMQDWLTQKPQSTIEIVRP